MATEQIRTEEPVPNTIHNLIQTLNVKLDSAARYSLYQEDARKDGYEDCAAIFARLAVQDHEAIKDLTTCLHMHLGQVVGHQTADERADEASAESYPASDPPSW